MVLFDKDDYDRKSNEMLSDKKTYRTVIQLHLWRGCFTPHNSKRKDLSHRTYTTDYISLVVALHFCMVFRKFTNLMFHSVPLIHLSALPPTNSLNIWTRSILSPLVGNSDSHVLTCYSLCPSLVPRSFNQITFGLL